MRLFVWLRVEFCLKLFFGVCRMELLIVDVRRVEISVYDCIDFYSSANPETYRDGSPALMSTNRLTLKRTGTVSPTLSQGRLKFSDC